MSIYFSDGKLALAVVAISVTDNNNAYSDEAFFDVRK